MTKLHSLLLICFWVTMMGFLINQDLRSFLKTGGQVRYQAVLSKERSEKFHIYMGPREEERLVGSYAKEVKITPGEGGYIQSILRISRQQLLAYSPATRLLGFIDHDLEYRSDITVNKDHVLDKLSIKFEGLGTPISVTGIPEGEQTLFVTFRKGQEVSQRTLRNLNLKEILSGDFTNFTSITKPHLGMKWRVHNFNPNLSGDLETSYREMEIVAHEHLLHENQLHKVYRAESIDRTTLRGISGKTRAWYLEDGTLLIQEFRIMGHTLTMRRVTEIAHAEDH